MIDWAAKETGCLRDRSLKQSSCKSPIIWWMVYLPNSWGETCIKIKRVLFFFVFFFGGVPVTAIDINLYNTSVFSVSARVGNEFNLRVILGYGKRGSAHLSPRIVLQREKNGFIDYEVSHFAPAWIPTCTNLTNTGHRGSEVSREVWISEMNRFDFQLAKKV